MGQNLFADWTVMVLGAVTLALIGGWIWLVTRKSKASAGEVVATLMVTKNETIFMVIITLIYIAEAMLAATVHPEGQIAPHPMARFITHLGISVAGLVANLTLVRDIASIAEKGVDPASRVFRFGVMMGVAFLSLAIPYYNAELISSGIGEDIPFQLYIYSLYPGVSSEEINSIAEAYGYSTPYNAWAALSYVMKTTWRLTVIHLVLSGVEAFRNMSSKERRGMLFLTEAQRAEIYGEEEEAEEEDKDKKKKKKKDKKKDKEDDDIISKNIEFLLRRVGYSGDKLTSQTKLAVQRLSKLDEEKNFAVAGSILDLKAKAEKIDKETDKDRKAKKKETLLQDIRTLFKKDLSLTLMKEKNE